MPCSFLDCVKSQVKLVIWDLDETFWKGTLSEEGIVPVASHIEMIRTLVNRGIMCSVCSKNDFTQGKEALERLGIWDLFVFPHIAWSPKGQAIAQMIEEMGLRDENVLFLDDNHLNLEEAAFFSKNLMVVDASKGDLTALLDLPQLRGKDDHGHSRLAQYKVMEQKKDERDNSGLSNVDFLRQSEIKIRIITDVENHMDRVLEILNRTNQLNFTKIRANSPAERQALEDSLRIPGVHAGLIQVHDRYGDYGIVGFYCIRRRFNGTTVNHFAFSCRTLNMGVEQWVWQHLGRPEFEVVGPVASKLTDYSDIDWIQEVAEFDGKVKAQSDRRLCLVGGCDLQQVSFYCGTNRDEFVNKPDDNGLIIRYDDAGFFLNPRDSGLKSNWVLRDIAGHTLSEMKALDESLANSDTIILSLLFAFLTSNLFTYEAQGQANRYLTTIPPKRLSGLVRDPWMAIRMLRVLHQMNLGQKAHLDLVRSCFEKAVRIKKAGAQVFILGTTETFGPRAEATRDSRAAYNAMCKAFCEQNPDCHFIDVDQLIPVSEFVDSDHYTRKGYFQIADFINARTTDVTPERLSA